MIYPENQKVSALIDLLEQTDLFTSRELNVMEEYLLGETEGKLPEQLHYRDMSQIGKETAKKMAAFPYICSDTVIVMKRWHWNRQKRRQPMGHVLQGMDIC